MDVLEIQVLQIKNLSGLCFHHHLHQLCYESNSHTK